VTCCAILDHCMHYTSPCYCGR